MPSLPFPWGLRTSPLAGVTVPGTVMVAGTFTTDSAGNVASVSGLHPGMSVSGTNLASGIYTAYFGEGQTLIPQTSAGIGQTAGIGELVQRSAFAQVLYMTAEVCGSGGSYIPTSMAVQTLSRDGLAASGQFQFLQSTVTTPLASGKYTSTPFVPAPFVNGTAQVLAILRLFKGQTT